MAAIESSGTQSATVGTEHELAAPTTLKTRVLLVDTANMVADDELELRIKLKVLTGGTVRQVYMASYIHAQADPIKPSIPVVMPFGGSITLKQVAGTSRNFDWSILTLD